MQPRISRKALVAVCLGSLLGVSASVKAQSGSSPGLSAEPVGMPVIAAPRGISPFSPAYPIYLQQLQMARIAQLQRMQAMQEFHMRMMHRILQARYGGQANQRGMAASKGESAESTAENHSPEKAVPPAKPEKLTEADLAPKAPASQPVEMAVPESNSQQGIFQYLRSKMARRGSSEISGPVVSDVVADAKPMIVDSGAVTKDSLPLQARVIEVLPSKESATARISSSSVEMLPVEKMQISSGKRQRVYQR